MPTKPSMTRCGDHTSMVHRHIGTAYDHVKVVAENIDEVIAVSGIVDDLTLYLGAHTEPPTTDKFGNPLRVGSTYWNLNVNLLYYWDGSEWIENSSVLVTQEYIVDLADGQTVVTAPQDLDNVVVFVIDSITGNERLVQDVDFTVAVDNVTITLNESYNSGSKLYFVFNDIDNAEGYATTILISEQNAANSASSAAISEANASASELAAQSSAITAQEAADSIGRYQGLWPDTGGSANKGDTYQTQTGGTPTGEYFTALQNTTVDPVGNNVNWRAIPSGSSGGGGGSMATYNTVSDMVAGVPTKAEVGTKVATQGYYNNYVGGAVYRITTLVDYRNEINDSVWVPDGYGDHLLDNGLVAILHHNGTYWADQIGLHCQYDTPQESLDAGVDHADDFNNMDAYFRKELSMQGTRGALILHIKGGSYYFNKTVWLPANVFLCGGSDWGAPHRAVKFVPLKPKYGGMIGNYHPLPNVPTLMDEFVPKTQAGGSEYLKLLNDWVSDDQGIIDVYYEFKRKELNDDTSEYGILGCEGKQTYLRSSGDKRRWICQFELNDGSIVKFAEEPPIRALEGKHRFERHADKLHWYILGSKIGEITVTDEITLNMFYNDYTMNRAFYGMVQYITLQTADFATNVYIEGYKRTPIDNTPTDLIMEGTQGNSAVLTNFTVGDEWKLKNKFNPNTREGFMFIWNSFPDSGGLKPEKSVYLSPYMGGMSSINVSNYEEDFDPENPYDKDYLKGISACMVYGGALFTHCEGNRIWTFAHRPEYESLDYYVDGWEVYNYKCNTPIENTHYQFDMNGTGDAVVFQGCQFPVNHPYDDYPEGEYPNGVVKAIKMQNSAFYQGQWTLSTQSPNSGMQINRCINGQYALHGVEAFQVNACHLEFGQVWARDSAGSVNDTYFSQITEVGRVYPQYPDVVADRGQYPSSSRTLMLKNCHFHRGFDGAHLPLNDYNIVVSDVHTVEIDNCYQGWNYSGSGPIQIGVTVGLKETTLDENETPSEVTEPLEGWSRWSHFLSNRASIVRGKIVPQTIVREIGGFGGIEDIFAIRSPTPLYWDIADDTTYYYQVQLLLDAGDQQTAEDPNWKPTGINPFIGYKEDGITPKETERSVYVPPASDSSWTRVLMNTYTQVRTLSQGVVRVYRGTASRNYTEYVDIPAMSLISMEDIGTTMYGRLWVPNPHAPDVAPINEAKNLDKFQIYMVGGKGFWESGAPQVQTGGISKLIDSGALQPQQIVLTSFRYFPNEVIGGKTTNIYVSEDKDAGDLYVTLDANAAVGTVVKVSGDFLSGVDDSVIVQVGGGVGVLGSFQSGGFLQAEKLGTETKSYWHVVARVAGAPAP